MLQPRQAHRHLALAATLLALFATSLPAFDLTPDPEPFRREDEIRGRDIRYNSISFMHRFSNPREQRKG